MQEHGRWRVKRRQKRWVGVTFTTFYFFCLHFFYRPSQLSISFIFIFLFARISFFLSRSYLGRTETLPPPEFNNMMELGKTQNNWVNSFKWDWEWLQLFFSSNWKAVNQPSMSNQGMGAAQWGQGQSRRRCREAFLYIFGEEIIFEILHNSIIMHKSQMKNQRCSN